MGDVSRFATLVKVSSHLVAMCGRFDMGRIELFALRHDSWAQRLVNIAQFGFLSVSAFWLIARLEFVERPDSFGAACITA